MTVPPTRKMPEVRLNLRPIWDSCNNDIIMVIFVTTEHWLLQSTAGCSELTKYPTRGENRITQNGDEPMITPVMVEEQPLAAAYIIKSCDNKKHEIILDTFTTGLE